MVIGGSNQEAQANVEVVDLSGEGQTCSRPADAPVQRAATGAYLNGGPTICGGKSDNLIHDQCYRYDSQVCAAFYRHFVHLIIYCSDRYLDHIRHFVPNPLLSRQLSFILRRNVALWRLHRRFQWSHFIF